MVKCVCFFASVLFGGVFYWGGSVWKRKFDKFDRRVFSDLSFAILRIWSNRSIRDGMSIFKSSVKEWIFNDLLVKLLRMYLNWRNVIDRGWLIMKNSTAGFRSFSGFFPRLFTELDRDRILIFFVSYFCLGSL
jgi:hypothetical protein